MFISDTRNVGSEIPFKIFVDLIQQIQGTNNFNL